MVETVSQRKTWDPAQDKRGIECRACGCRHFWVVYTRRGSGGRLIRRRECRHCGKRMTTWESAL
jgi:transcriptional regulator NrdR family protein